MRPHLRSFGAHQPQADQDSRPGAIVASCRALQAILGAPLSPQVSTIGPDRELGNPFEVKNGTNEKGIGPLQMPRGANKRRRSEFEEDSVQGKVGPADGTGHGRSSSDQFSTPKRQRRIPLAMPMGLSADDFDALLAPSEEDPQLDIPIPTPSNNGSDGDSGYEPSPADNDSNWTVEDDRILVETVLEKLTLSKRDWNECANKLGKDKDSIGRRWKLLVGEGNVGLRMRRGGRRRRTSLDDIRSWEIL